MNPAFSVIVFTTLSGTGFGLWFWLALRIALGDKAEWFDGIGWALGLIAGGVLVAIGVIASLWHLGKPMRVWRAFSQWRSSWMSREGVFAIASMGVAAAAVLVQSSFLELPNEPIAMRALCALLAPLSLAAIVSTAMIYGSLKTIPAWRHRLVVPVYLLFALLGGGLLFGPFAATTLDLPRMVGAAVLAAAIVLAAMKWRYWRAIDDDALPLSRGDAVGLPGREVSVFERPHTQPRDGFRRRPQTCAQAAHDRAAAVRAGARAVRAADAAVAAWWSCGAVLGRGAVVPGRRTGRALAVLRRSEACGDVVLLSHPETALFSVGGPSGPSSCLGPHEKARA